MEPPEDIIKNHDKYEMKQILKFYESKLKERGIPPNKHELKQFLKQHKFKSSPNVHKLRFYFEYAARFGRALQRPRKFAGPNFRKFGCCFLDLANYYPNYWGANKGMKCFLTLVESLTGKFAICALPNGKRKSWEHGLEEMLINQMHGQVTTIISDEDASVTAVSFRRYIYDTYGIKWYILEQHRHSYFSELAIRRCKQYFSLAMLQNAPTHNWVQFIEPILEYHNNQLIPNSTYKRNEITKENYYKLLIQLYGAPGADAVQNLGTTENFHPDMASQLFQYKIGDKVLIANYKNPEFAGKKFVKYSVVGNYAAKVYTVTHQVLKSSKDMYLIKCYRLKNFRGIIDEVHLRPANFSPHRTPKPAAAPTPTRPQTRQFARQQQDVS